MFCLFSRFPVLLASLNTLEERHLNLYVLYGSIHKNYNLETTQEQMAKNRSLDREMVGPIHNGLLVCHMKSQNYSICCSVNEIRESIMLHEVSQRKRDNTECFQLKFCIGVAVEFLKLEVNLSIYFVESVFQS